MPARARAQAVATPEGEAEAPQAQITLFRLNRVEAHIKIQGTAPLIVHRFDEKAKEAMLSKQRGRTATREAKVPEQDYERAFHRLPNGKPGFPAVGFKAATIGGARLFSGVTMTQLKTILGFKGDGPDALVEIVGEPKMREDYVRLPGTTDIRFRPQFDEWSATLKILFVPTSITAESLISLVDAGGLGGIGEWRPSSKNTSSGAFGTYEVVDGGYTETKA